MGANVNEIDHFVLTFVGGDMDGLVLDSRSARQRERTVIEMFLGGSNRGQTGRETKSLVSYQDVLQDKAQDRAVVSADTTAAKTRCHSYRALSRTVSDGVCHIMVNHTIVDFLPGFRCRMVERGERKGFFIDTK